MESRYYLGLLFLILDIKHIKCELKGEYETSACYGTHKNFLEPACSWGDKIKIHKVYQGAKPIASDCPYPTNENSYKEDCCVPSSDDCLLLIKTPGPNTYQARCNGKSTCKLLTMWSATTGRCDPKKYNSYTNFMKITYSCLSEIKLTSKVFHVNYTTTAISSTAAARSTADTTVPLRKTTPINARGSATNSTTTSTTPDEIRGITRVPSTSANIEDTSFAFTTGMMGAMVAAIIGMILTIFGFIFYWGRKRRRLTMTKPQTSVWDFLLAQSITFRPFRRGGYDNFNSHRSSFSSDGEASSPVTRKCGWTPNIAVEAVNVEPTTSDDNCSVVDVHRHI